MPVKGQEVFKKDTMKYIFTVLTFFLALASVAQAEDPKMGLLRGTVIDDDFGDPVMYAEVRVEGLDISTLTDLDGQYSFELAPGTYTLSVEFLGYAKQVVSEVVVKEGSTELVDVRLTEESEVITEVVVTATQSRNNETALLTIQKESPLLYSMASRLKVSVELGIVMQVRPSNGFQACRSKEEESTSMCVV